MVLDVAPLVTQERFGHDQTMNAVPDLASLARTIGDATRMRMLVLLMEGRALTAKELAYGAGVEPATATSHLRRLTDDGLLSVVSQGRHKYFRLASPAVAQFVEAAMVLAPRRASVTTGGTNDIKAARFCYDHLAGKLGIGLTNALVASRIIAADSDAFRLTRNGERKLSAFGVDVAAARQSRRRFAARCLDWSERSDHLAGSLGAALANRLVELGWVARRRDSRIVDVTPAGRRGLAREFTLSLTTG